MAAGYTTVSGNNLKDATGTLIASAIITFTPVSSVTGQPIPFRSGGTEGATCFVPVSTPVSSGAFTIQLADTALTYPVNVGYAVALYLIDPLLGVDYTQSVLGPGYGCIQPTGTSWSLDTYEPNLAPMVTVQQGPQGQPGIPGGVAGAMSVQVPTGAANGSNAVFTISGTPAIPMLFKNGLFQTAGIDYAIVGSTMTFVPAAVPQTGDTLFFIGVSPST